jgi:uncharacterized membrane protein YphA (DoxX/SURF4 family)
LSSIDPACHWAISLSLALLWLAAAWSKLRDQRDFHRLLLSYQVLPAPLAAALSWLLPCLELLVAVTLLIPAGRNIPALTAAALLLVYGLAMALNLLRGRHDLECGCTPGSGQFISWGLVWRNVLLCAASLALLIPVSDRPLRLIDLPTVTAITVLLCAAYLTVTSIMMERDASDRESD